MPERRLEDRIRNLRARLADCSDADFNQTLSELLIAIKEHLLRIQSRTRATVFTWPEFPRDRRIKVR